MGRRVKYDHIRWLIALSSDNIKRISLYFYDVHVNFMTNLPHTSNFSHCDIWDLVEVKYVPTYSLINQNFWTQEKNSDVRKYPVS